tara:strand:+ start:486 stop:1610 length:1125 start_codon:yes stop_codon:yes gene_type:complete
MFSLIGLAHNTLMGDFLMFSYMRNLCVLSLVFIVFYSMETSAYDVSGLYQARVPVLDRSSTELSRGASLALSRVLVKLTGQVELTSKPELMLLQSRAKEFLLQYTYEKRQENEKLYLVAEFDPNALAAELEPLDVPIWGKERPLTFLYVVVTRPTGRQIFTAQESATYLFENRASYRGIPVVFPETEEIGSDLSLFSPHDMEIFLEKKSLSRSSGQDTSSFMLGHLSQSALGIWEADWILQVGQERYRWKLESDILELLIEGSVDVLADSLVRRFADPVLLARAEQLTIEISGVRSLQDYARVCAYVDSLDTVSEIFVREITEGNLYLDVTAKGGPKALRQSISFGDLLVGTDGDLTGYLLNAKTVQESANLDE